jgi:hypothetical protein
MRRPRNANKHSYRYAAIESTMEARPALHPNEQLAHAVRASRSASNESVTERVVIPQIKVLPNR